MSRKTTTRTWYYRLHWSCHNNKVNGNIFITLVVYVQHMKKSEWLDCQGNEFFPKQKGTSSLVKIEHKNTATRFSQIEKNLKSQFCNYLLSIMWWPGSFQTVSRGPILVFFQYTLLHNESCEREARRTGHSGPQEMAIQFRQHYLCFAISCRSSGLLSSELSQSD